MLFNSLSFIIFFPVVTFLYYISSQKLRLIILLTASCIFYMFFIPYYIFILFFLILVDFFAGIFIGKSKGSKRKLFLFISILCNIGILFSFKYFNFFSSSVNQIAHFLHCNYPPFLLSVILPIGLSYHTIQSLSYVIEVYKKKQKPEKNLLIYALYVMFYPQLVAGPIERPQQMLPQFYKKIKLDEVNLTIGLQRILIGLFKKVVIADRLAILVNQVYATPHDYIGLPLIIATIAFSIQIYCDFSGYSDIAIGTAKVMGFNLVENFNYPYFARSISDFWRRWHMSLYSWFRDYVYIPLGGNRVSFKRHIVNILIVFGITGLWHGAAWTFIIWGFLHGMFLSIETISQKLFYKKHIANKLVQAVQLSVTFLLVSFAWVFFRANSLSDALYILGAFPKGLGAFFISIFRHDVRALNLYTFHQANGLGLSYTQLQIVCTAILFLLLYEVLCVKGIFPKIPQILKWIIFISMTLSIINLGSVNLLPFIYFQF